MMYSLSTAVALVTTPIVSLWNRRDTEVTRSHKQDILDRLGQKYLICDLNDHESTRLLVSVINKILQNPNCNLQDECETLSRLFINRGYFFQVAACPMSFSLLMIGTIFRICGHKIAEHAQFNSDLERAYLEIAMRLFFNLDQRQKGYIEYILPKLKVVWYPAAPSPSIELELSGYSAIVKPQSCDVKGMDELVRSAFVYRDLLDGLLHPHLSLDQVKEFVSSLMGGKKDTIAESCFDLTRRMRTRLIEYRQMSPLERIGTLIEKAEEVGVNIFSESITLPRESSEDEPVELRLDVKSAGMLLPSRINSLTFPIEEIDALLRTYGRSLCDPVSNFKIEISYNGEVVKARTAGSIYPAGLEKNPQNSPKIIEQILFAKAEKTLKNLFPDWDTSSAPRQKVLIDMRLLTRYCEANIFNKHTSVMSKAARKNEVMYFAIGPEAHSALDRVQGMNRYEDFESEETFSVQLKEFINAQIAEIARSVHVPHMMVILEKWNELCCPESLKHERNTIPFVLLTIMLSNHIEKYSHGYEPVSVFTCKFGKDRTFSVFAGIVSFYCMIMGRMEKGDEEFKENFQNLFTKKGYFNFPELSEHEAEVLHKSFSFGAFNASNAINEGVETNGNHFPYWVFFQLDPKFLGVSTQTASLWEMRK